MKTICVTGANRGLGYELTKEYCEAGDRVLACCRDPNAAHQLQKLKSDFDDRLTIIKLEVTDLNHIKNLPQQTQNETIDILINNAGIYGHENTEIEHWLHSFNVNVIAPYYIVQALLPQLLRGKTKIIANMSSKMGSIEMNAEGGSYSYRTSKAALNALTKNLSIDLKSKQVIVVTLHPGWVKTDMGGASAPLSPEQSIKGVRKVLNSLTLKDSGKYINYDGTHIPW